MANFTDFFENKIIDHMLRGQAYTVPTTIYLALFTAAPTDAGGGTEVTGGSYARQPITLGAAAAGASSNTSALTFSSMPGATVVAAAIMDALTVGNMLMHNTLSAPVTVVAGNNFVVPIGEVDVAVA